MSAGSAEQSANWRASTDPRMLARRAEIFEQIRGFFKQGNVLEVETPILERFAGNEAGLAKFTLNNRYLKTSHEIAMKRLLASGSGDIYQLGKVFRCNETGRLHNPEFTMLEWYRVGHDYQALMAETDRLIHTVSGSSRKLPDSVFISCETLFREAYGLDLFGTSPAMMLAQAYRAGLKHSSDAYDVFDFLVDTAVRQCFNPEGLTFLYDYPKSHALLAKVSDNIAQRFEVYLGSVELANGYTELTEAGEFLERFEQGRQRERAHELAETPLNEALYAALKHGLPESAGVSLGVDRLILLMSDKQNLSEVIPFPWELA